MDALKRAAKERQEIVEKYAKVRKVQLENNLFLMDKMQIFCTLCFLFVYISIDIIGNKSFR